jgi:uncharacterized protein YjeT (DUF2065 family)
MFGSDSGFWQMLGMAFGLMLVLEGLGPFLAPGGWRRVFAQIQQLTDGQIRFFGLVSIAAGLLWLWWQS